MLRGHVLDGLGVIGEVGRQRGVRERIAVGSNQVTVVGGDLLRFSIRKALCVDRAESCKPEEGDGAEGRHYARWLAVDSENRTC